jgi:GNAT superfamily N-acetyltransferase
MKINPAIRAGQVSDLPAIVRMRDELNALERAGCPHASIVPLTLEEFTTLWASSFDSPNHCWRIVEVDQRPVGFGLIYLTSPRTTPPGAYIHWAYLEEPFRRSGLGHALLQDLLDWAKQEGACRVELQFIDGNHIAERFWTKMGFRPFARKCVHYLNVEES